VNTSPYIDERQIASTTELIDENVTSSNEPSDADLHTCLSSLTSELLSELNNSLTSIDDERAFPFEIIDNNQMTSSIDQAFVQSNSTSSKLVDCIVYRTSSIVFSSSFFHLFRIIDTQESEINGSNQLSSDVGLVASVTPITTEQIEDVIGTRTAATDEFNQGTFREQSSEVDKQINEDENRTDSLASDATVTVERATSSALESEQVTCQPVLEHLPTSVDSFKDLTDHRKNQSLLKDDDSNQSIDTLNKLTRTENEIIHEQQQIIHSTSSETIGTESPVSIDHQPIIEGLSIDSAHERATTDDLIRVVDQMRLQSANNDLTLTTADSIMQSNMISSNDIGNDTNENIPNEPVIIEGKTTDAVDTEHVELNTSKEIIRTKSDDSVEKDESEHLTSDPSFEKVDDIITTPFVEQLPLCTLESAANIVSMKRSLSTDPSEKIVMNKFSIAEQNKNDQDRR
jgi:hypothetical protein